MWYDIYKTSQERVDQLNERLGSQEFVFLSSPILKREILKHKNECFETENYIGKNLLKEFDKIKGLPKYSKNIEIITENIKIIITESKIDQDLKKERADKTVGNFLNVSKGIYTDKEEVELLANAKQRINLAKHPDKSKEDNYADPINWIALLSYFKENHKGTLYIFTKDNDFNKYIESLTEEWESSTVNTKIEFKKTSKELWELLNIDITGYEEEIKAEAEDRETLKKIFTATGVGRAAAVAGLAAAGPGIGGTAAATVAATGTGMLLGGPLLGAMAVGGLGLLLYNLLKDPNDDESNS